MKKYLPYLIVFLLLILLSPRLKEGASGPEVKNIILFIGDGMGLEHVRAAGMYLNGEAGTLVFEGFPYRGEVTTYSASSAVTDSAAAATAIATGHKVNNRVISMAYPGDGGELPTLLEYYSALGKSTGLVSRTLITHATPASFGAHEPVRSNYESIALDYFTQTRPNLLLGGAGQGITPEAAASNGYTVVTTKNQLEALQPSANLFVSAQYGKGHMPYEDEAPASYPTLTEMTRTALALLETNGQGFFLLVEGGRIDHAAHDNDIEKTIGETIAFHHAVSYAYEWAQKRTDTLVVVTADHETGGLEILGNNGKGNLPDIAWGRTGHTGKNIGIYVYGARGAGIEGGIDNTDIYSLLKIPVYTLTVNSNTDKPAGIMVNPADNNGLGNGETGFTRQYNQWAAVNLTAPYYHNGMVFKEWVLEGKAYSSQSIRVVMTGNREVEVTYKPGVAAGLTVDRGGLTFGYASGGAPPPPQSIRVSRGAATSFQWETTVTGGWIKVNPGSGTGPGLLNVSVEPDGLSPGNYSGTITITGGGANTSPPVTVAVNLSVFHPSREQPPFGSFDSPAEGALVSSSVPVTGWSLDDVGLDKVQIFRDPVEGEGSDRIFIGEGYFVEGARPDIEISHPGYPANFKAGWGYMLLTNFLPNGSGTFVLHAEAVDFNGHRFLLGTRAITVDNESAVTPFGAMDTPAMGETVSGAVYRNQGWVLTPRPNIIPIDGTTIRAYIDGDEIGGTQYHEYREDIARLFPGYANSEHAFAYIDVDTRLFRDGIHTIAWLAIDSAGNADGIGSRFFNIGNNGGTVDSGRELRPRIAYDESVAAGSLRYWTGHRADRGKEVFPGDDGNIRITIRELERLVIRLPHHAPGITGGMVVGGDYRPLPPGSTLDARSNTFYWMPGPGFIGKYRLVFSHPARPGVGPIVIITIKAKHARPRHKERERF